MFGFIETLVIPILTKVLGEVLEEVGFFSRLWDRLMRPFKWLADKLGFSFEKRAVKRLKKRLKSRGIDVDLHKDALAKALRSLLASGKLPTREEFIVACEEQGVPRDFVERLWSEIFSWLRETYVSALAGDDEKFRSLIISYLFDVQQDRELIRRLSEDVKMLRELMREFRDALRSAYNFLVRTANQRGLYADIARSVRESIESSLQEFCDKMLQHLGLATGLAEM